MSIYRQNLINYWRQWYPEWEIPKGFHVHHIIPQSCGGSNHPSNLIALHPDDHVAIHKNRGDRFAGNIISTIGRTLTEETKRKMSEAKKGKKRTEETKRKISNAHKGKKFSSEHKKKISDAGKKRNHSKETKQKMSASKIGSTLSDNHKKRISDSHIGLKHSEKTKQKMSRARKGIPRPKFACRISDRKEFDATTWSRYN